MDVVPFAIDQEPPLQLPYADSIPRRKITVNSLVRLKNIFEEFAACTVCGKMVSSANPRSVGSDVWRGDTVRDMHELALEDSARDGSRNVVILSSRGVTRYLLIFKQTDQEL